MKINSLISALARGYWLVESRYADRYLPLVADILQGKPSAGFAEDEKNENAALNAGYTLYEEGGVYHKLSEEEEPQPESIYVVSVRGAVMKEDYCGIPGTATVRQKLRIALQQDNIKSAILIVDSGGGSVDGTLELAEDIRDIQAATGKKVIGFVDGIACSAGYWMLAPCAEIIASSRTAEVGSIGVCTTIRDYREALTQMGVKEHYINATTSPDKNQEYLKARDGKPEMLQARLDKIHAIFKQTVTEGRADISSDALTGKVFMAEEAVEKNLIDAIGSLEMAVRRADKIANPSN